MPMPWPELAAANGPLSTAQMPSTDTDTDIGRNFPVSNKRADDTATRDTARELRAEHTATT